LPARRSSRKSSPRKSSVGPNPTRIVSHHGVPVSSGWAFSTTLLVSSRRDRALVSANAGTSVWNRVVGAPWLKLVGVLKVPWMAVPTEVISATFPLVIWFRKNGLYGMRTRWGACVAWLPAQKLSASRTTPTRTQIGLMRKARRWGR
jgi:hypothetical protein